MLYRIREIEALFCNKIRWHISIHRIYSEFLKRKINKSQTCSLEDNNEVGENFNELKIVRRSLSAQRFIKKPLLSYRMPDKKSFHPVFVLFRVNGASTVY